VYSFFAVIGFLVLYLVKLRRMPVLNQVLALTTLSILLPFVSFEYTLVHLIVPFILLLIFLVTDIASGVVPLKRSEILALLIPFAILFAPLSFLIFFSVGFGAQIKALVLVHLVILCLRIPLPSSLFGDLDQVRVFASSSNEDASNRVPEFDLRRRQ
jgi:O-antigen ligase